MRTFFPAVLAALLLCGAIAGGAADPEGTLRVKLKPAVVVPVGDIRLGQIAEVSAGGSGLGVELAAMSLGNTPLAGNVRTMSRDHVIMFLTRNGFREENINLQGARACTVTVNTLKITGDRIVRCARDYLASMPILQGNNTQIEIERMPRDRRIAVGAESESAPELVASVSSMDRPWGRIRVYVKIRSNNRILATVPVMFQVTNRQNVVYAAKAIRRGDTIDETCVSIREMILGATNGNTSFLDRPQLVVGKKARLPIAAGVPIVAAMLNDPFATRRGENVSVVLKSRHIEIVAKGTALNDGHIGDVIPVTVGATGKRVVGKVVSAGTVQMSL